ncbi:hypothetical protein [Planococcus sp. ISL-109]|uniref:hypothetical protein n=1 Tax=Planococcus sp. ISL-109 TaxID=2819166 RepID=UPI001BE94ED7|nr:hypothetical protein [Planococcus sp. ISL-109]MBT2581507.1 hypothetical protein [Planococcus sp. ISL-109]
MKKRSTPRNLETERKGPTPGGLRGTGETMAARSLAALVRRPTPGKRAPEAQSNSTSYLQKSASY